MPKIQFNKSNKTIARFSFKPKVLISKTEGEVKDTTDSI